MPTYTSNGSWQNYCRIEWSWTLPAVTQGMTSMTAAVQAFLRTDGYTSLAANGSKSWSGHWGSGSAAQNYTLSPNQRVLIVSGGGSSVTLTDAAQTRNFTATANHWFGTTTSTVSVTFPARFAVTPTSLTVTRVSDGQMNLAWTRNSTYTSVVVQRRTNGGSWQAVGQPTGNAASFTDSTTSAGNQYEYRVAGVGGSGQSEWSSIVTIFTTPNAPSNVVAVRNIDDTITITADAPHSWISLFATFNEADENLSDVYDDNTLPFTDPAPGGGIKKYRVQAEVYNPGQTPDILTSAFSEWSNTVQLIAPPNAPVTLAPNGVAVASDEAVRFSWVHNPVDSSPQSAYELRYRIGAGAWTTLSGTTAQHRDVTLTEAAYEWQARTKGADPDWSPWSATATVTVITRPGVAITLPGASYDQPTLPAAWSWFQAQALPQSAWQTVLLDENLAQIEARSGTNAATTVTFTARLEHGRTYTVRARAATGAVWSAWAEQTFTVEFVAPAPATVDGVWVEEAGAVELAIAAQTGIMPDIVNHAPSLFGPTTPVEVRRNRALRPMPDTSWVAQWGAGGNGVIDTQSVGPGGLPMRVMEWTVVPTANSPRMIVANVRPAVTPGEAIPVSLLVASTYNHNVRLNFDFYLAGVLQSSAVAPTVALSGNGPGNPLLLSHTVTVPAGVDQMSVYLHNQASYPTLLGQKLFASQMMIGPGSYFDGDGQSVPDADLTERWVGTPGQSASVLEGQHPVGFTDSLCVSILHTREDGAVELRQIPTGATGAARDSFTSFAIPAGALRTVGGTVLAQLRLPAPLTGALYTAYSRRVVAYAPTQQSTQPPNAAGEHAQRLAYTGPLTSNYFVRLYHGGHTGSGDTYWSDLGLFDAGYDGPAFDEATGLIQIDGHWYVTEADSGHSKAVSLPATETVQVERSVDGGKSWEPFAAGIVPDENGDIHLTDWESLSYGSTLYRVTTYAASGASMAVTPEVVADSPALWLSGGSGYARTARLPFDPKVSIDAGRARALKRYAGREYPVAYSGDAVTRTIQVSGRTADEALAGQSTADVEALAEVVIERSPLHMFRDPDGRRVYGVVGSVQMPRETVTTGTERPWNGIWGYGFTLTETGR